MLVSEWSASLWTHTPRVTEVATGHVLFDLWGTSWDAQADWIGRSGLRLDLRRYDRAGTVALLFDFATYSYRVGPRGNPLPLAGVRQQMEEAFEQAHARHLESLMASDPGPGETPVASRAPPSAAVCATPSRRTLISIVPATLAALFGRKST